MMTLIVLVLIVLAIRRLLRAAPTIVRFGSEHPEVVKGGWTLLRRAFRR